jgi:hypothetical protein
MTYQTIEVHNSTPHIGAEIRGVDLSNPLGNQQFQARRARRISRARRTRAGVSSPAAMMMALSPVPLSTALPCRRCSRKSARARSTLSWSIRSTG